jgi:hypothetical protein
MTINQRKFVGVIACIGIFIAWSSITTLLGFPHMGGGLAIIFGFLPLEAFVWHKITDPSRGGKEDEKPATDNKLSVSGPQVDRSGQIVQPNNQTSVRSDNLGYQRKNTANPSINRKEVNPLIWIFIGLFVVVGALIACVSYNNRLINGDLTSPPENGKFYTDDEIIVLDKVEEPLQNRTITFSHEYFDPYFKISFDYPDDWVQKKPVSDANILMKFMSCRKSGMNLMVTVSNCSPDNREQALPAKKLNGTFCRAGNSAGWVDVKYDEWEDIIIGGQPGAISEFHAKMKNGSSFTPNHRLNAVTFSPDGTRRITLGFSSSVSGGLTKEDISDARILLKTVRFQTADLR